MPGGTQLVRVALGVLLLAGGCAADDPVDRADSVVAVRAIACDRDSRGVGVVVGEGRVLTNAHVVAGADALEIDGRPAVVVGFDPNRDLALVDVDGLGRAGVAVDRASQGDTGVLVGIDATERIVRHAFEVRRAIRATGDDIYRIEGADRRALEVEVEFAPGWSGSGLFDPPGRLVGLAFAESRRRPGVAYAVDGAEITDFLATIERDATAVAVGPCL